MSDNHLAKIVYDETTIRNLLSEVQRLVVQASVDLATPVTQSGPKLFALTKRSETEEIAADLIPDGKHDGYEDSYKRTSTANELSAVLGQMTWRDKLSEKIMWAYAAPDSTTLRLRLIVLVATIIQWIAELEFRTRAAKSGES